MVVSITEAISCNKIGYQLIHMASLNIMSQLLQSDAASFLLKVMKRVPRPADC